jgi:hypothetical protein
VTPSSLDRSIPCEIHEQAYCAWCYPPESTYRRGVRSPDVPENHYVEIRGGRGVYHHADCYNVTGDWDGGDMATLGERLIHSADDIRRLGLRPAACCDPPLFA